MLVSLLVCSPPSASVASRMLFNIICRNIASTCSDTARMVEGEVGPFFSAARPFRSV
jgi:hypothetical protein